MGIPAEAEATSQFYNFRFFNHDRALDGRTCDFVLALPPPHVPLLSDSSEVCSCKHASTPHASSVTFEIEVLMHTADIALGEDDTRLVCFYSTPSTEKVCVKNDKPLHFPRRFISSDTYEYPPVTIGQIRELPRRRKSAPSPSCVLHRKENRSVEANVSK